MTDDEKKALVRKHAEVVKRFQTFINSDADIYWDKIDFADMAFGFCMGANLPMEEAYDLAYRINMEQVRFE